MTVEGLWHRALESDLGGTCVTGKTWLFDTTKQGIKVWDGTRHAHVAAAGERINLRSFGAKDDNSTDNSEFLQKALNTGLPVFVPRTTSSFNFATTITFPKDAILYGEGAIQINGSMTSKLKYTGAGSAFTTNSGGTFNTWGLTVNGVYLTTTTGTVGIGLTNAINIVIDGNTIEGFSSASISRTGNDELVHVTIANNLLTGSASAYYDATAITGSVVTIERNRIAGNNTAGRNGLIEFAIGVADLRIVGNSFDNNTGPGSAIYFSDGNRGIEITGNRFAPTLAGEINQHGITFAGATQNVGISITGNEFRGYIANHTGSAVRFTAGGGTGVHIRGNTILNFATTAGKIALDPGGFAFADSDWSANYISGANTNYGTFASGSYVSYPTGLLVRPTTPLEAAYGGTCNTTYAVGDLLYASATTPTLAKLAAGSCGTFLRYVGVNTAPTVSTLTLPNVLTVKQVLYGTATNEVGGRAGLVFDGTVLGVGTATVSNASANTVARIALPNATQLAGENAAGGTIYHMIGLNSSNQLVLDGEALGIRFGTNRTGAAVAANFTADYYILFKDGAGNNFYIPGRNATW